MISRQHKFIFIAIPKCAGTSVRKVLKPYSESGNFKTIYGENYGDGLIGKLRSKMPRQEKYFRTIVTSPEMHLQLVRSLTQPEYFMFTFVRNPFDRTVSLWRYLKPKLTFIEFIDWLENDNINKSFHDLAHIKSCSFYLNLYQNMFPNNYVGHVENINNDFRHVCKKVSLPSLEVPKIRQTNHKKYQEYYNSKSIRRIEKFYAQDLEMLDYHF